MIKTYIHHDTTFSCRNQDATSLPSTGFLIYSRHSTKTLLKHKGIKGFFMSRWGFPDSSVGKESFSLCLAFPHYNQWLQRKDKEKDEEIVMGMPWRRLKWFFLDCSMSCWMGQKVTCVPWILSVCLSIFLHGFQPNNSPAWLHHRLDMSPFLFVSFVTRRSACKVECNSLLSLSSQVSIHLFRRKGGHCTLDSDHL